MKTCIQKWGHSLAIRLPKAFAAGLGFAAGSPAEISLEEGAIVVRPDRDRLWTLDELLAGVTDDNLHPVWAAGPEHPGLNVDGGEGARHDEENE